MTNCWRCHTQQHGAADLRTGSTGPGVTLGVPGVTPEPGLGWWDPQAPLGWGWGWSAARVVCSAAPSPHHKILGSFSCWSVPGFGSLERRLQPSAPQCVPPWLLRTLHSHQTLMIQQRHEQHGHFVELTEFPATLQPQPLQPSAHSPGGAGVV